MEIGYLYSFFKWQSWLIPFYKKAEVIYLLFLQNRFSGMEEDCIYGIVYRINKKNSTGWKLWAFTKINHLFERFLFIVFSDTAYYFKLVKYRFGVINNAPKRYPENAFCNEYAEPFLFRGFFGVIRNRIVIAHRVKIVGYMTQLKTNMRVCEILVSDQSNRRQRELIQNCFSAPFYKN